MCVENLADFGICLPVKYCSGDRILTIPINQSDGNNPVFSYSNSLATVQSSARDNFLLSFHSQPRTPLLWSRVVDRIIWTACFHLFQGSATHTHCRCDHLLWSDMPTLPLTSMFAMDHHRWRYTMLLRRQATLMVRCRCSLVQNSRSEPTNHTKTPNCISCYCIDFFF